MIELDLRGTVGTVTLNRPPVNGLNPEWVARFTAVIDEIEAAGTVTVMRIRSAQRVFSVGADLKFMSSRFENAAGRSDIRQFVDALQRLYARLERLPLVSIAQIGGPAMGGGLELALSCDFRALAESASIGLPEVHIGLIPGAGGTQRLSRLAGLAVARRMILTGVHMSADEALRSRVCDWVVPESELDSECERIAARLASFPKETLAAGKLCLSAAYDQSRDGFREELDATSLLLQQPATHQRIHAFLVGSGRKA